MNLQSFLFKLFIILTYILRVALLIFPIAAVIVITKEGGWKYGFTFIQNKIDVAIFVSFALGFLISLYHAVSFDEIEGAPLQNYMRVKQSVVVKGDKDLAQVYGHLLDSTKYKGVVQQGNVIHARRKVHFLSPDKVSIQDCGDSFLLKSQPFTTLWFIDFGRNFKNVKELAKYIKLGK